MWQRFAAGRVLRQLPHCFWMTGTMWGDDIPISDFTENGGRRLDENKRGGPHLPHYAPRPLQDKRRRHHHSS